MVEAPGTAPGSVKLIPQNVYRHSRLPDDYYYRPAKNFCKDHLRFNLRWRAFCAKGIIGEIFLTPENFHVRE